MELKNSSDHKVLYRFVYTTCNNFNYRVIRFHKGKLKTPKDPSNKAEAAMQSVWKMKSRVRNHNLKKGIIKDPPGWTYARIEAVNGTEKIVYNHNKTWDERIYELVVWANEKSHKPINEISDLFKIKSYYETSKLNMMLRNPNLGIEHTPKDMYDRCERQIKKLNKLKTVNNNDQYSLWDWRFRIIKRTFMNKREDPWYDCVQNAVGKMEGNS